MNNYWSVTDSVVPNQPAEQPDDEPRPQAGFIWVDEDDDEPRAKPQRKRATTRSRSKRVEPLAFDDSKAVIAIGIAAVDRVAALLSPDKWGAVPRLSGGDEIIARYLDALTSSDEPEVERLASALAEAYGENEWLARLFRAVEKYGKKGAPFAKLAIACVAVFMPRLLALGLIPNPFNPQGTPDDSADVESGRAHGNRGDDGEREIDFDGVPSGPMPEAIYRAEVQSGQRQVSESANGYESEYDFASESRPLGTAPPFHGRA